MLGVFTTVDWLRHRDRLRRFLALSVGLLGCVALLASVSTLGFDTTGLTTDLSLIFFLGSGWAFLRFRDSLTAYRVGVRRAVDLIVALTAFVLVIAYAPGTVSASHVTALQSGAALALLAVWAGCVVEPIWRIWSLSGRRASVQRSRLRALVSAYAGIVLILVMSVVAGFAPAADAVVQAVVTPLSLLLVPLFYCAFAPPRWVRRFWREAEEQEFRQALGDLLLYSPNRRALAERAVEWAARLVGADAAMIATDDSEVLVTHGLDSDSYWQIVRGAAAAGATEPGTTTRRAPHNVIQVPLRSQFGSGVLAVRAGPLTPLFGEEEVVRLHDYAAALITALDRCLLVEQLHLSAELLDLAYNPILTWSVKSGRYLYWNRAAEATFGWSATEMVGTVAGELLRSELPITRDEILVELRARQQWEGEIAQTTKDGRRLLVSARWALRQDAAGQPDVVIEVNRDITREKDDAEALRRARDQAERASAAKSEYLSRMSHELRTPLTAILGYSDLIELRDPRHDQLEAVGAIQEASSHLLSLVNDVLDIARIESGRDVVAPESVPVPAAVEESMRLVAPAARERGIELTKELAGVGDAIVAADRQRLIQALLNLLSNAVKYSGSGAQVRVAVAAGGRDRLRITVTDTGPGLSKEQQRRLFQPFERLGAERSTTPGTGLGLALTKKLIESMGGTVGVDSAPGRGSAFWIELQRAALDVAPAAAPPPTRVRASAGGTVQHVVLYVEDNLATIDLIEQIFRMRPAVRIISALQGSMALDLAREHKPDLVILDLHLPDISGEQVLQQLRADPQTADIPVVMFSADATERQVSRMLELGARDYLVKPAKVTDFLQMLDSVLTTPAPAAS